MKQKLFAIPALKENGKGKLHEKKRTDRLSKSLELKTEDWKKAIVSLGKDQTIKVHEEV